MALKDFVASTDTNLFGEQVVRETSLRDKFIEPPFSVLDARTGAWQSRKRRWIDLGIKSEIGREDNQLKYSEMINESRKSYTGTSVFDSALTELMYHWFCPDGGEILDPFAGGSVRGIVAAYQGYKYTGIELRKEQVISNGEQAHKIIPDKSPNWITGDSDAVLDDLIGEFDFVFSCPPYFDLEVYSDLPDDLSNMDYTHFLSKYRSIITKSVRHLKKDCYAVFVVGDIRDKRGYYRDFLGETKRAFIDAGAGLYNEMVLLENGLNTAAMRANKQFMAGGKVVKTHQNVLCFKKQ
jgi:hypothetical protein